jgi:hypothetical protein
MHDLLRERILRHLEALPDDRLYQVLDYIEFLTSKYARSGVRPPASPFQRFGERLEDKLRGNSVGFGAIRSTLEAVGTADRVVSGLAEAGRSLLREVSGNETSEGSPAAAPERRIPPAPRDGFPVDG